MSLTNFQQLLINNKDHLQPFALRLTRCEQSAKDLIQDTLLLAWTHQAKFQWGTSIRAWLYTIMHHSFVNKYRKHKKRKQAESSLQQTRQMHSVQSDTNAAAHRLSIQHILKLAFQLPDVFREPLQLRLEGYCYAEIACLLNTQVGTVKSRIHFGRKLLKQLLEE
jgi:RNA polymerase sigma factor (sigma-70 family)